MTRRIRDPLLGILCVLLLATYSGAANFDEAAVAARVDALMACGNLTGIVAAVLAPGAETPLVLARGLACVEHNVPMPPQAVMRYASVTKAVTAMRVKRCIEAGLLRLDTDVRPFFPELTAQVPITVEHLLTHTSGLADIFDISEIHNDPFLPRRPQDIVRLIGSKPLLFAPGSQQKYCNSGYFLLGMLLERDEFRVIGALFGPEGVAEHLGMRTVRTGDDSAVIPHMACGYTRQGDELRLPLRLSVSLAQGTGDLVGTAESLVMLARAGKVLRNTGFEPAQLVCPTLTDGSPAMQHDPGLDWNETLTRGLTVILFPDGRKLVGKDGLYPGFAAQFWLDPVTGGAVAILANQEQAFSDIKQLAFDILADYQRMGVAP